MDQKSIILSFLLTYVNTTLNNSSITEANYNTQTRSSISITVSRTNVILYLSITIVVLSYTWYKQNIVCMKALILETNS
jgi:hypothetical protein